MSRGPLIAAWAVTLAVLGGAVAWIEAAGPPERPVEPALTLVLPDRPKPAATVPTEPAGSAPQSSPEAPAPAEPDPAEPNPVEPGSTEPARAEPDEGDREPPGPAVTEPPPQESAAADAPPPPAEPAAAAVPEAIPPTADTTTPGLALNDPDPDLVEDGPHGPLPVIGPLGRKPWQVYARPFEPRDGRPRIAVVVTDLGLSAVTSGAAIEKLPGAVTLAFLSYAEDADTWIRRARADGHEILLALPMETDVRTDDPGPRALSAAADPDRNVDELEWHLGRASAYAGLTTHMGARFLAAEDAVRGVMSAVRDRGLLVLDASADATSTVPRVAADLGVPFAIVDHMIDPIPSKAAIERRLAEVETVARARGVAVAVGHPYPATIDAVAEWAAGLERRGFDLAPVSAVVGPPETSGRPAASGGRP